jgi:hypothetical protein
MHLPRAGTVRDCPAHPAGGHGQLCQHHVGAGCAAGAIIGILAGLLSLLLHSASIMKIENYCTFGLKVTR